MKPAHKLLIISRDTLLKALNEPSSDKVFRVLAKLTRSGYYLLFSAPEPDRWVPTRGNVDDALQSQADLMDRTRAAGADCEGVYYVPRSLLTQDRNREGALRDILKRYSVDAEVTTLISSSTPFLKAGSRLGISGIEVTPRGKRGCSLAEALERIQ